MSAQKREGPISGAHTSKLTAKNLTPCSSILYSFARFPDSLGSQKDPMVICLYGGLSKQGYPWRPHGYERMGHSYGALRSYQVETDIPKIVSYRISVEHPVNMRRVLRLSPTNPEPSHFTPDTP